MKLKNLYLIGGTMGVGKTTVCQDLKRKLDNAVFLDGDWCWDANPFQVTEETKIMVIENICFLLNQFLHCSTYENIIFCWVMHEQSIINDIKSKLDLADCNVKNITLVCSKEKLIDRLKKDVEKGIRKDDVIQRSVERIELYKSLNTIKLDVSNNSVNEVVEIISKL